MTLQFTEPQARVRIRFYIQACIKEISSLPGRGTQAQGLGTEGGQPQGPAGAGLEANVLSGGGRQSARLRGAVWLGDGAH